MDYGIVIPSREKLVNIKTTLDSIRNQSVAPKQVIVVDDGSENGLEELLNEYNYTYIKFNIEHKESWVSKPELTLVFNMGIRALDMNNLEYFMILGSDTILEKDYVSKVVSKVKDDIVIASGIIANEKSNIPRGSGRIFRVSFWNEYIKEFPYCYAWESFPLFKAKVLGFNVYIHKDAIMHVKRTTRTYKPLYGRAMKEIGYIMPYVIGRSMLYALHTGDLRSAFQTINEYMKWNSKVIDEDIARYVRKYQYERIKQILRLR